MKIKFTDWKYVNYDDNFFVNDEDDYGVQLNEGEWMFEVDGKSYHWIVRKEEYFDREDIWYEGYLVKNDNEKILFDSRCKNWGYDTFCESDTMVFSKNNDKFNNEISVGEILFEIEKYLSENIKGEESEILPGFHPTLEINDVTSMDDWGKEKLIGYEFEIDLMED
jgi:hypothetical protein